MTGNRLHLAEFADLVDLLPIAEGDDDGLIGYPFILNTDHPDDPVAALAAAHYADGRVGMMVYNFDKRRGTRIVLEPAEAEALAGYLMGVR
jgi:hypothetical protein